MSRLANPYLPRRPQETVLYGLVKEHWRDFVQHAREAYEAPLPKYVVDEFQKYLRCGDFAERARFESLVQRVYARVMKWLSRRGLLRGADDADASNARLRSRPPRRWPARACSEERSSPFASRATSHSRTTRASHHHHRRLA